LVGYTVHLENELGVRISEKRTYKIDGAYYEHSRYVLFSNSLGGFDTLRATGQSQENLKVVRQMADRYLPFAGSATYSERIINRITGERELTIRTGYLTEAETKYLQELLFAKECYLQTDREYIPLTLISDGYTAAEDEVYLRGREFVFAYSNKTQNYSRLPIAPALIARNKAWRVIGVAASCELNDHGLYTGMGRYNLLEQYYTDDSTAVVPQTIKKNIPGTEGYIALWASTVCELADTPFVNVRKTKLSSFAKNNCLGFNQEGQKLELVVAAGTWGSEISQADADAKALAELESLNTQAYVNANGVCRQLVWIGYGTQINCLTNEFGLRTGVGYYDMVQLIHQDDSSPVVPAQIQPNKIMTQVFQNGQPLFENGQPVMNTTYIVDPTMVASCAITPYRSVAINRAIDFRSQLCVAPMVGSPIVVSIKKNKYGSEISQADADAKAEAAWAVFNTQIYANEVGSCELLTYYNVAYSALGTYSRSNCGVDYVGGKATISIAAGVYSSTISQADADAKAEAALAALNTQAYANANGSCVIIPYLPGLKTSFYNYAHSGPNPWGSDPSAATRGFEVLKHSSIEPTMVFFDINNANTYPLAKANGWNGKESAIRFEGYIDMPSAGAIEFLANFDDGIVLKINGVVVIDRWYYEGGISNYILGTAINVPAGKLPIVVEYYNADGFGALGLQWKPAGTNNFVAIPNSALSHLD
jgi:Family of unknown function (DUF5977)